MNNSSQKLPEPITLEDRISDFPDEILCHILSFLDTKQAVATSILSKRWKFLWTYVEILVLSDDRIYWSNIEKKSQYMRFVRFVRRVLELHRAPLIKRMQLICNGLCYVGCYSHDFVTRILTVVCSKSVQSLYLCLPSDDPNMWPLDFFCSKTLVELIVTYADITRNSPTAPFFPNLKKLHLNETRVNAASLARFISGCSILEDVSLDCYIEYDSLEPCCISSTTIKSLDLCCPASIDKPYIVLNTPALEVFKIRGTKLLLLVESSMPSLHKAHIYIYLYGLHDNLISNSSLMLLEIFSNVSVLCLEVKHHGIIQPAKLDFGVQFHKLTELEIRGPWICLDLLKKFMEKSNNLQVITLKKTTSYEEREVIWEEPQHVPECLLSSLQRICIKGYINEDKVELMMIKYVLGNAKVLKSMEMHKSYFEEIDIEFRLHMLRKISMFPRASPTCEISVN